MVDTTLAGSGGSFSFWSKNHNHPSPFHRWLVFDFGDVTQLFGKVYEQLFPLLCIEHITATELYGSFYLVSVREKASCVTGFELQVMIIRVGPKPEFFHLHGMLLLLGFFLLFLLFIHEFTEIDHLADRWISIRRNFNQVHFERFSNLERPFKINNFMAFIRLDYPDGRRPDLFIDIGSVVIALAARS